MEDTVQYTYDANGNVLTVTDKNGTISRAYDALNRVTAYTDTYGNIVRYTYDSVGNLVTITYPDDTAVAYEYDAVGNLTTVTDWAGRVTTYTYDENNHVIGVVKPDGSTTTTVYDAQQRITSTVERTASGTVITGFEYTYDALSRIVEEKVLAKNTKLCYTYDDLNRVTKRTEIDLATGAETVENYAYDAAGNIHADGTAYDTNNRLTLHNYQTVAYDEDGNMTCAGSLYCTYDSANRLTSAGGQTYTYNAENTRIRNTCGQYDTTYVYNTNARLSQLLMKTTNGIVTKYVYGLGLIGEEKLGNFKTYHFDYRGSTVAITDAYGNITDTFEYDTYGNLLNHTGSSFVIFGYNGRDGVVTDSNGLIYMRARYYAPHLKRFVNADIVSGELSNAVTLNRYAYANGNPVSFVDPFGLSADDRNGGLVSIEEFVESRGGTVAWNKSKTRGKFTLNEIELSCNTFGSKELDVLKTNNGFFATEYDLAYYFKVDDWATYFPGFKWYSGQEDEEGSEGFEVKTTIHFLDQDFCLDYAEWIIAEKGVDGEYLGQDQQGIAEECYAHAFLYLWTNISIILIDRGHRYNASAKEIGYVADDPHRKMYKIIWNLS